MAPSPSLTKLDPVLRLLLSEASEPHSVHVIAGLAPGQRVPPDFEGVPVERCGPVARTLCLKTAAIARLADETWVAYVKAVEQLGPKPGRPA